MNQVNRLPAPQSIEESFASAGPPPQAHDESPFVIFEKLHHLLRGRYIIAIVLAAIGAIAGVVAGWKATVPKYQSVGSIRVLSSIPVKIYPDANINQFNNPHAYVRTQANLLQDPRVIERAVRTAEWKPFGGSTPQEKEKFRKSLVIATEREDPEWIRVKFTHPDPRAAKAAVESVIDSYVAIHGDRERIITPELINELELIRDRLDADVQVVMRQIQIISQRWNSIDLELLHKVQQEELTELRKQIAGLQAQIQQAETEAAGLESGSVAAEKQDAVSLAAEIANVDLVVRNALMEYLDAQAHLRALRSRGSTDQNPAVKRSARREADSKLLLEDAVAAFINRGGVIPGNDMLMASIPPAALETMRQNLKTYEQRRQELLNGPDGIQQLSNNIFEMQGKREELKEKKEELAAVERRIRILKTESSDSETMSTRIEIMNKGEEPTSPYSDPRKKLAAVGFVLGGGMPVAFIMLLGLVDRRFRYSDEAVGSKRHTQLLGILPYLPARMHDPEQAAVAAHCVHQIRTLLQIGGQMFDRRVFTITSPTAGDGKTSLSLSLGLSFAASGSKTLLLDFDMIGGGLTSGMQAKGEHGVMDAIAAGSAAEFIKPTSFPNLSILPVGLDDAQQVSRLSPSVVRRLVEELRGQFEVVVIDTGPILGSIEASLACAAADGVILALGRGQQRGHADRAIEHLEAIGAKLLGVVFNRADSADFKRSVSSASVRSAPMIDKAHSGGNGHASKLRALPAMGPMASTVASGMRGADDSDDTHEGRA